ncbi:MAG: hypothetical protein ACYDD1_16980 [Caulobacteraceae bacterium]
MSSTRKKPAKAVVKQVAWWQTVGMAAIAFQITTHVVQTVTCRGECGPRGLIAWADMHAGSASWVQAIAVPFALVIASVTAIIPALLRRLDQADNDDLVLEAVTPIITRMQFAVRIWEQSQASKKPVKPEFLATLLTELENSNYERLTHRRLRQRLRRVKNFLVFMTPHRSLSKEQTELWSLARVGEGQAAALAKYISEFSTHLQKDLEHRRMRRSVRLDLPKSMKVTPPEDMNAAGRSRVVNLLRRHTLRFTSRRRQGDVFDAIAQATLAMQLANASPSPSSVSEMAQQQESTSSTSAVEPVETPSEDRASREED